MTLEMYLSKQDLWEIHNILLTRLNNIEEYSAMDREIRSCNRIIKEFLEGIKFLGYDWPQPEQWEKK
jgi:hypothetical protein